MAVAIVCTVFSFQFDAAWAASNTSKTQIEACGGASEDYLFALCAATTCNETGKRIRVNTPNGGKRWFREVQCTCPVVNTNTATASNDPIVQAAYPTALPAIANVTGGNMRGSCAYPESAAGYSGGIWSLYSTVAQFPQKTTLNGDTWATSPATLNHCSKTLNQGRRFANCFSFKCGAPYLSNGVLVSDCSCPQGEDVLSALPAPAATSFFTNAGGNASTQDEKDAYCSAQPVGGF
jgi:hypothetical protein